MASTKVKKWGLIILVVLLVVIVGGIVGFRMAAGLIKGKVVEALGPDSEIKDLKLGLYSVQVEGLRIKGRQGWPAADTLRTERVVIVPSLLSLLTGKIRVASITVVRPYLSALRTRDGKLLVVPSLLEAPTPKGKGAAAPPARTVAISRIRLQDGVVELFDATVAQPPLKIRLEQIQATVRNLVVPTLTGKSPFEFTALLKGVQRDGRASLSGWAEVATKDSSVKTELRSVDLVALQPYLSQAAETRLQRGALDLDLTSEVRQNRLRAPGKVVIADLEFASTRGTLDTFMGVPRGALVNSLKTKDKRMTVDFIIEGDINNPRFGLNEAFASRIASSLAENLGVSLRGVAAGVEEQLKRKGVGGAIEELLGTVKRR
jgi:uncharacterized protein involved in outer membrane biogenesis